MNDDFGSNFDLGSFDDLAAANLGNFDFGSLDLGNFADFGSLADLGSFEDIAAADLGNLGLGNLDLGNLDLGNIDFGSLADLGSFADLNAADFGGLNYNQPSNQQGLTNAFAGSGSSNFNGANMMGNLSNKLPIAQIADIISQGAPLGGGYIKPARVGRGYGFKWQKPFNQGGEVKGFAEGGYDFDLGSFDDLAAVDLGNLSDVDFGSNFDLGSFEDLSAADLGNFDFGSDFDLGSFEDLSAVDLGNLADIDFGSNFDLGSFEDLSAIDGLDLGGGSELDALLGGAGADTNLDFGSNFDLGSFEDIKNVDYLNDMFGTGNQNFGSSVDMDKSAQDFDANLTDIVENRGSRTSDWQKTKDGRYIKINDDGSGIGFDEDGNSFALSASQVGDRIKSGDLNTFASGYNTATGGNKIAPGGGSSVVLKNGSTGQLLTNGKVIDTTTGKVIGTGSDVKNVITTDGDGKKIVTPPPDRPVSPPPPRPPVPPTPPKPPQNMNGLLPLLLALLAMSKGGGGGGGGGSRGATIPGLTATQKQTPYAQQQRAPGYRPGQGGVTYFDQTQYAPRMAAGGGIASLGRGRLLRGPGDGVSDSIPAMIVDRMSKGGQPAKVARGEYIIDARTVAALGNGSTDAGAERLDKMRKNILRDDRKAGVGKDSKAYRHLLA